jgi:hypothetical protein
MPSSSPSVAIFFVRAWMEEGQFRARTKQCSAVGLEATTEEVTGDAATVVDQLRCWLQDLADQG